MQKLCNFASASTSATVFLRLNFICIALLRIDHGCASMPNIHSIWTIYNWEWWKLYESFVPPKTAAYGDEVYGVFLYTLSPKRHNPRAKTPCSSFWNRDIPLNTRQLEVELGYWMDMSCILPKVSNTAWHFNPNFFFLPHKNFPRLHPASLQQSFGDGLCILIRIPSIAPAQHPNQQ